MEGIVGATPGKLMTGLKTTTLEGAKPGIAKAFLRRLAVPIDATWMIPAAIAVAAGAIDLIWLGVAYVVPGLGVASLLRTNPSQRIGDKAAGTIVVPATHRAAGSALSNARAVHGHDDADGVTRPASCPQPSEDDAEGEDEGWRPSE